MKQPRTPKPKLESPWRLWRAAVTELRMNWKAYAKILAFIALPIDLLGAIAGVSSDAAANAYSTVAAVIMNVALIWAIVQHRKTGKVPTVAASYYDGSVVIVRFLLVTFALVLMLIPAAFAFVFYAASLNALSAGGAVGEQLLIALVCLLVALPSLWLIVRFGLAPLAAVDAGLRPMAALRYARKLTLGRFWRTVGRFIMLILFVILIGVPIAAVTALLSLLKLGPVSTLFFQLATTFTVLPLANIYLLNFMRNLEAVPGAHTASATLEKIDTPTEDELEDL